MAHIAKSHITHNGKEYPIGHEVVGLEPAQAAQLISDGVLVDTSTGAAVPAKAPGSRVTDRKKDPKSDKAAGEKALKDAKAKQTKEVKAGKAKKAAEVKTAKAAAKAKAKPSAGAPADGAADPAAGL